MNKLQQILILLILMTGIVIPVFADENPGQVFVFGDSLSDVGNGAIVQGSPLPPPFYNNRVSNGPVAVEAVAAEHGTLLAPSLMGGTNYAVATARAGGVRPIDLSGQVQSFLMNFPAGAPADALYIMMIGGNDVRDARDEFSPTAATQMLRNGVDGIALALQTLIDHGARNILVVNSPDLGRVPETRMIAAELGDWFTTAATLKSLRFNARLFWKVKQLEWRNRLPIKQFNLLQNLNQILNNGEDYTFTNTTDACFNPYVVPVAYNPACDFNTFAFFDPIHPTAKMHALIGSRMGEKVEQKRFQKRYYAFNH